MEKIAPYSDILKALTELVDGMASGTMFIHSKCNHAITIAMTKGRLHAIYFGPKKGRKAITLISRIAGGTYRFEKTDFVETSHDLPNTPEILNLLRNPDANTEIKASYTAPNNEKAITDNLKTALCQNLKGEFTKHMGPIADMLFDDIAEEVGDFCATPQLTENLINKLSEEIDGSNQAEDFRIKSFKILNDIINR
jgi:hypothetical protein